MAIPITDRDVLLVALLFSMGLCAWRPEYGIYCFIFSVCAFAFHLVVYDKRKKELKLMRDDIDKMKERLSQIALGKAFKG